METAMQLLIQYLDPIHSEIHSYATKLLELEKGQMKSAYLAGKNDTLQKLSVIGGKDKNFEDYYKKLFK